MARTAWGVALLLASAWTRAAALIIVSVALVLLGTMAMRWLWAR